MDYLSLTVLLEVAKITDTRHDDRTRRRRLIASGARFSTTDMRTVEHIIDTRMEVGCQLFLWNHGELTLMPANYRIQLPQRRPREREARYTNSSHPLLEILGSIRLDLEHYLCLITLDNKLGLSPPNRPDSKVKRVLDLGTGTGIWAIDFGDEHPEAEVQKELSQSLRK